MGRKITRLAIGALLLGPALLGAQQPATTTTNGQPFALSLDEALRRATGASENVIIARSGEQRARGAYACSGTTTGEEWLRGRDAEIEVVFGCEDACERRLRAGPGVDCSRARGNAGELVLQLLLPVHRGAELRHECRLRLPELAPSALLARACDRDAFTGARCALEGFIE